MGWLLRPARPAGALTRTVRRLASPRFYLKGVIAVALGGLVIVPTIADLVNAGMKTVASDQGNCRIVRVVDGDTVSLICPEDGMVSARLLGFDTPEKYAPKCLDEFLAAEKASWALRTLIQKADRLVLTHDGSDRYGRALVKLELDGVDVARLMV
ncbi:MAG TPA: thermonuclease family protein, partial [Tabrizicola sp.]|nr:thermonuclease family protein [Tabrizicola sp.]